MVEKLIHKESKLWINSQVILNIENSPFKKQDKNSGHDEKSYAVFVVL